ncbi:MAG: hypothetical protein HY202_09055 [Nitrospirae bacterium]|nr:hypothetical protein [Nitrospirota bacterium]
MAEIIDKKETVSLEQLVVSQMWEMEALYNLLEKKGVITKNELLEEIQRIKKTKPER